MGNKIGPWNDCLKNSDINQIWKELHRIVSSHPLVRSSKRAGFLVEEDKFNAYTDLTQELFVVLLSKDRFQHYIDTSMTDVAIESEISQLELTNMLTAELRKRYPESYRMARRISSMVQTSKTFKRFDNIGNKDVHIRLANHQYGLSEWPDNKESLNKEEMKERVKDVPVHARNVRLVGCTADAQIIINGRDLEKLIIRVLEAVDSPIDVRSLRSLVMSRLTIMDISTLVSIRSGYTTNDNNDDDDRKKDDYEPIDPCENPELSLLSKEYGVNMIVRVDDFLADLNKSVRGKRRQYNRMMSVLWHCYLIPDGGNQLEVAEMLGVSDSLVSDYRKRIDLNLQLLVDSFGSLEEARQFQRVLTVKVRDLIAQNCEEKVAV